MITQVPHDIHFMQRAIELARQGRGWTSPNPMSGALVVREGAIVGEGFHPRAGKPHAEIFALDAAGDAAEGATLYVTVEPCQHTGRTPPCVERIVAAGIRRVVIAMADPNPLVAGKGMRALEAAGIEVELGIEGETAAALNEIATKYFLTRRPFVAIRTAMSLDGKIATPMGESQMVEGPSALEQIEELRATFDAVMLGVNTVSQDNPDIRCMLPRARDPLAIVIDSMARMPANSRLLAKGGATGLLRPSTIVAVTRFAPDDRVRALKAAGAEVLVCPEMGATFDPHVDLGKLMAMLGKREITSVLLEGGGNLNAAALAAGVVDKVYATIVPRIIGGQQAPTPVEGLGASFIEEAIPLHRMGCRSLGSEILIEAYLHP